METPVEQTPPVETSTVSEERAPKKARRKVAKATKEAKTTKQSAPGLDEIMALLDAQDEVLKSFSAQTKEMLSCNANLRRTVRKVVKEASRKDELTAELNRYKKKFEGLKSLIA